MCGRLYMSETVLAPDELQDWRDEDETGGGECGGWGDADSDALDDNVDAAEQSIREKRKRDMQLKIQRHQASVYNWVWYSTEKNHTILACSKREFLPYKTSRERPKSAPYLRLKNSKRTSKCRVFSSTVPV